MSSRSGRGLSAKILAWTVLFILVAEAAVFLPSAARERRIRLQEQVTAAYLAVMLAESMPAFLIDDALRRELLISAGVRSVRIQRDGRVRVAMAEPDLPSPDARFNLTKGGWPALIGDFLDTMLAPVPRLIEVTGPPPADAVTLRGRVEVAIITGEAPLRLALVEYCLRGALLALGIATATSLLLWFALRHALIAPLETLAASLTAFRRDPEGAAPPPRMDRGDEIGVVRNELAVMQDDLRKSLAQRRRLADLGVAVAKISHDLRNILATAQLLGDRLPDSADPEVRRVAPRMIAALDRALALCTQTMRRGAVEEPPPQRSRFPLAPLVAEADDATGGGLAVAARFDAGMTLSADREQLFRILVNLLRNAKSALALTDGVKPPIDVAAGLGEGGAWIEIADRGPGLPDRVRASLFVPFAGSGGPAAGTGLGLAISRDLARGHGGDLVLAETGPGGTRFRLTLPQGGDRE